MMDGRDSERRSGVRALLVCVSLILQFLILQQIFWFPSSSQQQILVSLVRPTVAVGGTPHPPQHVLSQAFGFKGCENSRLRFKRLPS